MPLLDLLWSMLWFFVLIAWFWMLISIIGDIFASDMSGWGKAGWSLFVIVLPLLGSFIYLIVNGGAMQERSAAAAAAVDQAQRDYVRSIAGSPRPSPTRSASSPHSVDQGAISDAEVEAAKSKLVAS